MCRYRLTLGKFNITIRMMHDGMWMQMEILRTHLHTEKLFSAQLIYSNTTGVVTTIERIQTINQNWYLFHSDGSVSVNDVYLAISQLESVRFNCRKLARIANACKWEIDCSFFYSIKIEMKTFICYISNELKTTIDSIRCSYITTSIFIHSHEWAYYFVNS